MLILSKPVSEAVYNQMLTFPTRSDRGIAKSLNLSQPTVSKYRRKLYVAIDHHLAKNVAGKFLAHFQMGSDYMMKQIEKIETLKEEAQGFKEDGTKTVFKKGSEGQSYAEEEDLNAFDKLVINKEIAALEKQQTELWSKILFLCRQSEAVEVIKLIQNGELPVVN